MRRVIGAVGCWLLLGASGAGAADFVVQPGNDNLVVFVSQAPVESFEGKTHRLSGRVSADPAALTDSVTVHFECDMASLDTGIKMRNKHMREEHLETDQYPRATLDGVAVLGPKGAALEPGKPVNLEVEGTFTLHGVSRRLHLTVNVVYTAEGGGRLAFQTTFPVALPDYQISRPQFLFLKLAEVQQVKVSGVALAAAK